MNDPGFIGPQRPRFSAAFRKRRVRNGEPHRSTKPACHLWRPPAETDLGALQHKYITEVRRASGRHGFGTTDDQGWRWILMAEWQQGQCAVCGTRIGKHVIDHDHDSGLVRGFLCGSCNTLEGCGHHGPFDLYRERPPAAICGVVRLYWSA